MFFTLIRFQNQSMIILIITNYNKPVLTLTDDAYRSASRLFFKS